MKLFLLLERGASVTQANKASAITGAKEIAIEKLFGGIPAMGKGAIGIDNVMNKFIKSSIGKTIVSRASQAIGEGAEEVVSSVLQPFVQRAIYNPQAEFATFDELTQAFGGGTIASLILGVPVDIANATKTASIGKQYQKQAEDAQAQRTDYKIGALMEANEAAEWAKYRDEARQILPAVESAQKNLVNNLHKAVDGLGFEVIDPAPKSAESTADKIYRKRNNEGIANYSIASIKDHTRASVIVNNIKDISQAVEALKQVYPDLQGEVLRQKGGYIGYHLTVKGTDGINSEIQLVTPDSLRIKKIDDEFYQKWRNVDKNKMSAKEQMSMIADRKFTKKLWDAYYSGIAPDVMDSTFSSVTGETRHQMPSASAFSNDVQTPFLNSKINSLEPGTIESNLPSLVKPYSMSAIDNTPPVSDNITPKDENVNGNESIADADIMTADFDSLTPRQQAQRVIFKGEYLSEAHIHKSIQPVMVKEAGNDVVNSTEQASYTAANAQASISDVNVPKVQENYLQEGVHTAEMQKVIQEYDNAVDEGLVRFVKRVLNREVSNKYSYKMQYLSERAANDIKKLIGIEAIDYNYVLDGNAVEHINKGHGQNGTSNQSMANMEDLGRMQYVLDNYDNVKILKNAKGNVVTSFNYRNSDNTQAQEIMFTKRINGSYYVVVAIPDSKAHKLHIVSAYKSEARQVRNANAPGTTSETPLPVTPLNNFNVQQKDNNVKHNIKDEA
ncbi:MAG: hypothetical protein RR413_11835, partial [Christensenellaceae bacterium]